jgi:hypothetical protein
MRERQTGDVVRPYGKAIAAQHGELLARRIDDSLMSKPRRRHLRRHARITASTDGRPRRSCACIFAIRSCRRLRPRPRSVYQT